MRSFAPAGPPVVYPDRSGGPFAFAGDIFAVADAEIRKLRHDPLELIMRAVQPTLWLVVFGQVMSRIRGVPTGRLSYLDFMAPGILAQSVLFIAIFYGVAAIRERDLGVLNKYMVSPISRTALVLGKAVSAGARALSQAAIVYVLALLMHIHATLEPLYVAGVLGMCPYSMSRGYNRVTIATSRATNAMSTAKSTPRPRVLAPPRTSSARNPSTS